VAELLSRREFEAMCRRAGWDRDEGWYDRSYETYRQHAGEIPSFRLRPLVPRPHVVPATARVTYEGRVSSEQAIAAALAYVRERYGRAQAWAAYAQGGSYGTRQVYQRYVGPQGFWSRPRARDARNWSLAAWVVGRVGAKVVAQIARAYYHRLRNPDDGR
jgi:hypothetical protein